MTGAALFAAESTGMFGAQADRQASVATTDAVSTTTITSSEMSKNGGDENGEKSTAPNAPNAKEATPNPNARVMNGDRP